MEIVSEKPDLAKLPKFQHFAAIIKAGTTGLSFRDNKLYVMPGNNNTIKVQSSPAGKREMMENMAEIKQMPEPQLVLKGDEFVVNKLNGVIELHRSTAKSVECKSLDDIVAAYQRVLWNDGTINDVIIYHADLLKAKGKSKIKGDGGVWGEWPGEAAKKVSTNRAFRLYHKYPDNIVTFGADDDKADDTSYQEVQSEESHSPQEEVQEAQVVADKPKKATGMDEFLKDN